MAKKNSQNDNLNATALMQGVKYDWTDWQEDGVCSSGGEIHGWWNEECGPLRGVLKEEAFAFESDYGTAQARKVELLFPAIASTGEERTLKQLEAGSIVAVIAKAATREVATLPEGTEVLLKPIGKIPTRAGKSFWKVDVKYRAPSPKVDL